MKTFVFILLFPLACLAKSICYFTPPSGWEFAHPKNLSPQVQIAFVGKGSSDFRPSLNLATEDVDVSLKEYLKCVRQIHESELNVKWRDLGAFTFQSGKGRLSEIDSSSPAGEVKMLQGIFIQDGCAYILTAAVSKDDFSSMQKDLLAALRSLTVSPNLFAPILDAKKKHDLEAAFGSYENLKSQKQRQNAWEELQKIVLEDHASLGSCWQALALKEGYLRIFDSESKP